MSEPTRAEPCPRCGVVTPHERCYLPRTGPTPATPAPVPDAAVVLGPTAIKVTTDWLRRKQVAGASVAADLIDALQAELATLRAENEATLQRVAAEIAEYRTALDKVIDESERLRAELNTFKSDVSEYVHDGDDFNWVEAVIAIRAWREQNTQLRIRVAELEAELDSATMLANMPGGSKLTGGPRHGGG